MTLTWLILDGLDSHTLQCVDLSSSPLNEPPSGWVESHHELNPFGPREHFVQSVLRTVLSATPQSERGIDLGLLDIQLSKLHSKSKDVHVFAVMAEAERKVGFSHLIHFLQVASSLPVDRYHLHMICPSAKESTFLLPLDCLYQLEEWIQRQGTPDRYELASFVGADRAFYRSESYFHELSQPTDRLGAHRTFRRDSLRALLQSGYTDSNIPLHDFNRFRSFSHEALCVAISDYQPFAQSLQDFTSPERCLTFDSRTPLRLMLVDKILEANQMSYTDLTPTQILKNLIHKPNLESSKIFPTGKSDFHLCLDDSISRAVATGIKGRVQSQLISLRNELLNDVPQAREGFLLISGLTSTTYSLTNWEIHMQSPRVPVWGFKSKRRLDASREVGTLFDLSATLFEWLGHSLPTAFAGKSLIPAL